MVANALDHCGLPPAGNPETMEMALPEELTGSLWGVLDSVLENTFIVGNPEPYRAWILTMGDAVCCIWETDGAATPNLLARACPL